MQQLGKLVLQMEDIVNIHNFNPLDYESAEVLFEYTNDGIYITDSEANTIYVNHRYELISGLQKSEILGKNMKDMVEDGIISQSGTLAVLRDGNRVTMEQSFRTGRRAVITSSPIYTGEGPAKHLIMVLTVVNEVTEIYSIRRELERLQDQNQYYQNEIAMLRQEVSGTSTFVAEDRSSKEARRLAHRAALLDDPVFISGEIGTGREFFARGIHTCSRRSKFPFLKIDFTVIPEETVVDYLFGYVTPDSHEFKRGILESAAGGTVYINEINDMPSSVRSRFLALIQHGACVQGDGKMARLNIRFIVGSHFTYKELQEQSDIEDSLIRALMIVQIHLKPLRERRDDIIPLAQYFINQVNAHSNSKKAFSKECIKNMMEYDWPGNAEEMRIKIRRAAVVSLTDTIGTSDLFIENELGMEAGSSDEPELSIPDCEHIDMKAELSKIEAAYMVKAFNRYGNARQAAKSLGMDSSTFVRKRQKYVKMGLMDSARG